jgi:predicted dehydrogenase
MSETKIRVAFIGAGYMTTEHMKAFVDIDEISIAGIFSKTRSKAEKLTELYPGAIVCDSIHELYEKTKAAIVVVSVPEMVVAGIAAECFQYPWMCLFEKPLGLNLPEAEKIDALARQSASKVFVLLNRRHYASTKAVLADAENMQGSRLIYVQDQEDIKVQYEKGTPKLLIDNWMYANAIHVIDYFCFLGRGEITKVDNIVPWDPANPQYVISKIEYASGDIGMYQAIWNAPAPWIVSVTSSFRRWEMRPLEQATYQDYGSRRSNQIEPDTWDTQFKPGLREQAEQAVNAFKGLPNTMPSLTESLVTMKLIHKIYGI